MKSKKENLVAYFNLLEEPVGQSEDFIFVKAEVFRYADEKKYTVVDIPLDINFYLDLLLYRKEFDTFTELYFSYGFIGKFDKICNRGYIKDLCVDSGVINGMSKEKEFKLLKEIDYV